MLNISVESTNPTKKKTSVLCGFVLEKTNQVIGLGKTDSKIDQAIRESINEMEGKFGKISIINTLGKIPAKRILLAGLGQKEKINNDSFRFVAGKIAKEVRERNLSDFTIIVPNSSVYEPSLSVSQIVEGCKLSLYAFDEYKKTKAKKSPNLAILVSKSSQVLKTAKSAEKISDGVIFTKSLANLPPNVCTPEMLAKYAKKLSTKTKIRCKIFTKSELKKNGFGGITAVGQGSKNEPRL
ncbi:MAG: M17 family peptidase N-terminal domain-containing protein, partial [Nitrosopumilaceae archaeon]|nr:M17 family peptidase N-terminal domain-containing protein [Nitrosopumilaceae archaeon]